MKKNEKLILFIPLTIIVLTFITVLVRGHINFNDINFDKLGGLGSFIGGLVGTFLTIVATLYIYKTYHSQKEELQSQKSELILQRQLIAQQQFESTFFNLLNTHRELKNELTMYRLTPEITMMEGAGFTIKKEKLIGLEVLEEVNKYFMNYFYKITKRQISITEIFNDNKFAIRDFKLEQDVKEYNEQIASNNSEKEILTFVYKKIFEKFQDEISHYCRNVYHILKFIRESEENESDLNKKLSFRKYADIFQSQLNVNEQFLLFYNFINFNVNDNEEYLHPKNIVNHYKFLENLGSNNLLDKELHNNKIFYTFEIK